MSVPKADLESPRRDIDAIDDAIHDLIMRRAGLIGRVAAAKVGPGPAYRPEREAGIMRRLLARHRGPFPAAALIQVWREIMSASVALQRPITVAVCAPADGAPLAALARGHFGSLAPLASYATASEALDAVARGDAAVAVLPVPGRDDAEPWWHRLTGGGHAVSPVRVVGRIPFLRADGGEALVAAALEPQDSGDDETLLAIETPARPDDGDVVRAAAAAGLGETVILDGRAGGDAWLTLALVRGLIGDEGLAALTSAGALDIRQVHRLGAYPSQARGDAAQGE